MLVLKRDLSPEDGRRVTDYIRSFSHLFPQENMTDGRSHREVVNEPDLSLHSHRKFAEVRGMLISVLCSQRSTHLVIVRRRGLYLGGDTGM